MKIHHLSKEKSLLCKYLREIRSIGVQNDSMRFRKNIERIGEILAYELSKNLTFESVEVETPLGIKETKLPVNRLVLCSVLRAGIPLHNGLLNYFDDAENAFISAYRKHSDNEEEFDIVVEYLASPAIEGKTLLLADSMIATGRSLVAVYESLKKHGIPKEIHILSVIGSKEGIELIREFFPENTNLWVADIDEELNSKGYIVPGLGDVGDLAFGSKL